MRGRKLLEEIELEDGDDVVELVNKLESEYSECNDELVEGWDDDEEEGSGSGMWYTSDMIFSKPTPKDINYFGITSTDRVKALLLPAAVAMKILIAAFGSDTAMDIIPEMRESLYKEGKIAFGAVLSNHGRVSFVLFNGPSTKLTLGYKAGNGFSDYGSPSSNLNELLANYLDVSEWKYLAKHSEVIVETKEA
jgi:hypothetical protein